MEKCCTWDNGSAWLKDWPCKIYLDQWPIFHGPLILPYVIIIEVNYFYTLWNAGGQGVFVPLRALALVSTSSMYCVPKQQMVWVDRAFGVARYDEYLFYMGQLSFIKMVQNSICYSFEAEFSSDSFAVWWVILHQATCMKPKEHDCFVLRLFMLHWTELHLIWWNPYCYRNYCIQNICSAGRPRGRRDRFERDRPPRRREDREKRDRDRENKEKDKEKSMEKEKKTNGEEGGGAVKRSRSPKKSMSPRRSRSPVRRRPRIVPRYVVQVPKYNLCM